jgi:lipopolysaccharide transport system ATP-binding protein
MGHTAIRAENLAKMFYIGQGRRTSYVTLRDRLSQLVGRPFRRPDAAPGYGRRETIWALNDVSFSIDHGEVVGIIGYNGAGKSTLLKVLSRITEPTRGQATIYGRVASLLEVGTGFHPELTGRENTYLNGAILGMRRAEIDRKFDEIVAFAEIEKFIDTPVKFYSSGMYVRLAFAVAAHLEPEILIVDEVLAVGDARFQKKCLNKMQNVGEQGRTVLFVSHSMPAITRLCQRTILLDAGCVAADGPSHRVVSRYLQAGTGAAAVREWPDPATAPGGEIARLRSVRIRAADGQVADALDIRKPIGLEMEYEVIKPGYRLLPHFHVANEEGMRLFTTLETDQAWRNRTRPVGRYVSTAWIPGNLLSEGTIFIHPTMVTQDGRMVQFSENEAVAAQVIDSTEGDSARGEYVGKLGGLIRPLLEWTTVFEPVEETPVEALLEGVAHGQR